MRGNDSGVPSRSYVETKLALGVLKKNSAHKASAMSAAATTTAGRDGGKIDLRNKNTPEPFDFYSTPSLLSAGVVITILGVVLFLFTTNLSAQTEHRKSMETPRRQIDAPAASLVSGNRARDQ